MCELLGLNFNLPVNPSFSFRGFSHRGEQNPHGWGIARYDGKACQIFKEPFNAEKSELAVFIRDYDRLLSAIFIGHVRDASKGAHTLENTHPFTRVLGYREVVLAHNGTLELEIPEAELDFHPLGETDSELLFCALLTQLNRNRISWSDFSSIESLLSEFNQFGTMNLLFSEGEHLFCYKDRDGHNGLCLVERVSPFGLVSLQDEDWEIDLSAEKHPGQRGYVIASHPLTKNEPWTDIIPGSLLVLKSGSIIYGP